MDEAKTQEICRWLQKADHDLLSAERLFRGGPAPLDTAVYHCQQAACSMRCFVSTIDIKHHLRLS